MRSRRFAFLVILLCTSAAARAFAAASLTPLGDLPGGDFSSHATGVSGDGSVVVGISNSASGNQAFRWTSGGGIVGLSGPSGSSAESGAAGISVDGAPRGDQIRFRFEKNRPLRSRRQANPSAATPAPRRSFCAPRSTAVCILTQITHHTKPIRGNSSVNWNHQAAQPGRDHL